jgi:hypothetical protein
MHYISGTSFAVKSYTNAWDKKFKLHTLYTLIRIQPFDEKVKYVFNNSYEKVEMVFDTCRQADLFIAKHRRENIPEYNYQ